MSTTEGHVLRFDPVTQGSAYRQRALIWLVGQLKLYYTLDEY